MRLFKLFSLPIFLIVFQFGLGQTTIYVNSGSGNDTTGNGSALTPYKTFHKGYSEAASGDILNLTGTFTWTNAGETGDAVKTGYTINKDITIIGQSPDETIIQADTASGTANMRVFTVANTVDNLTIKNVTIQNGHLSDHITDDGGVGIHFNRYQTNQTVLIENCNINENHNTKADQPSQWYAGGAIWAYNTLDNDSSSITIKNTTISNNTSNNWGAVIFVYANSNNPMKVKFEGCTISNNRSYNKSPIMGYYGWLEFINCTISNNKANYSIIDHDWNGELSIINTTIAYNENTGGSNFAAVDISSNDGNGDYGAHNLYIKNSIISNNNLTETDPKDLRVSSISSENISYSAIKSENSTAVDGQNGNIVGFVSNPVESTLKYNGSANRQKTLKLTSSSIAIDSGDNSSINNIAIPEKDQRSYLRSGTIDMGAVELTELTDLKTGLYWGNTNSTDTPYIIGGNMYDRSLGFSSDGNYLGVAEKVNNGTGVIWVYEWDRDYPDAYGPTMSPAVSPNGEATVSFGDLVVLNEDGSKLWVSDKMYDSNKGKVYQYNSGNGNYMYANISFTGSGNANDYFGNSISVSDNEILVIGEPGANKVYVYDLNTPANNFTINSAMLEYGKKIDLSSDANYLAISSQLAEKVEVRQAVRDDNGIIIRYDLVGSEIQKSTSNGNSFGRQIQISDNGKKLVVGSPSQDNLSGAIYIYTYVDGSGWSLTQSIKNPEFPSQSYFGGQIEMDKNGNFLIVGATSGLSNGEVYLFSYNSSTSLFEFNRSFQADGITKFGHSVAISRNGTKAAFTNYTGRLTGGVGGSLYPLNIADTSSPTISISKSPDYINNTNNATITFTFNEEVIGFTEDDINLIGGGTKSNFTATSSSVYTLNYTPPSNSTGTVTITVNDNEAQDLSGNFNVSSTLSFLYDTISPTLSSFTDDHIDSIVRDADTVEITATFSEAMSNSPTISIAGLVTNAAMTVSTTSASRTWSYSWNVPSGNDGTVAATVSGTDLFGNYYSGTESLTYTIDNVSPTLTITKPAGTYSSQSVVVTLTYDETVTGLTTNTADFSEAINVASLTLLSASTDGKVYTILITPTANGLVKLTHAPGSPAVTDLAGNTISSTVSCSFIYDGSPPTINQITSSMANGTYTDYDGNNALSDTISVTVSFTETVSVDTTNGSPRLLLNTTPASYVYYLDGSGTATLTFENLVNEEVKADDLNISAFELNGGTIVDLASNTASLTLDYVTSNSTNLSDLKNIVIDAKNPTISNYSLSNNNNLAPIPTTSVNDGNIATFGFQSDKELLLSSLTVTFTGFTPTITKTVSGTGPFSYEISFTVSSTFPEGDVEIDISATDQVTTTVVPIGNPTGVFTEEAFPDRIRIDRTAPTITSSANLNSDENTTAGPTITASEGVIFSIDGGADQALLSINQQTGVLTFSSAPDYEAPVDTGADNTYEIIVKAIDAVGLTVTQTVTIQINDLNDTFGVAVTPTDVQTSEDGDIATIGFVLITEPTANVTFGLSLSDETEGNLNVTLLTFTPDNWNVTQNITVDGVDDGLADGDVTYQLITANSVSDDTNYNGLVIDDVTLTNIDDEIDSDGDGFFDYQDDFPNDPTEWLDTDNDGLGNNTDLDDDGDGISDVYEIQLGTDPLDPNDTPSDFNSNGIPDALEDSDGDGYNDAIDLYPLDPTKALDFDGDGIDDNEDLDDDNDGIPDTEDDFPLDNRFSKDTDKDGIPNLTDPDDDGDGYEDAEDTFPLDRTEHIDTDNDGIGNNADLDDDADGIADLEEDEFITIKQSYFIRVEKQTANNKIVIPLPFPKKRSVGKWKIRKRVSGGADKDQFTISSGEPASNINNQNQKNDGTEGYLVFLFPPDPNNPRDHNKDNIYEVEVSYINTTGGDANVPVPQNQSTISVAPLTINVIELNTEPTPREEAPQFEIVADLDADDLQNSLDPDDDGDGIFTFFETENGDTDLDEYPNFHDPDDDNDGIFTFFENPDPNKDFNPKDAQDTNGNGVKDYLDNDDDGDGILTWNEKPDPNADGNPSDALDFDEDGTPDYLDTDDDNDGLLTSVERLKDTDRDGTPDYHDTDDDDDGVPTLFELDASGNPLDTDGDGVIDAIDTDDDGDGLLTILEDLNGNGDPQDDDTDFDGVANYLESRLLDQDNDGVADEFDSVDDDPYNDQDGDGYPNLDEKLAGTNPLDPNSYPDGFNNPALRASIDIVSFFSPNSDGINDTWQVKEIERYPNNQVWIFTRTGYEVFNAQNYRNDWSGTQNGNPLPEGSYYYRIDLDGNSSIDFEGWLYLTR